MPNHLPWTDRFEVGVSELDSDHRLMVAEINAFCSSSEGGAPKDVLIARLDRLVDLAKAHFSREGEVIHGISGLPAEHAALHEREHDARLNQLAAARARVAGDCSPDELSELGAELIDWFIQQAIGFDAQVRAYFVDR